MRAPRCLLQRPQFFGSEWRALQVIKLLESGALRLAYWPVSVRGTHNYRKNHLFGLNLLIPALLQSWDLGFQFHAKMQAAR